MIVVGSLFALVAMVWVVLDHIRSIRPQMEDVEAAITAALAALPKPVDLTVEVQALTRKVGSLETAQGIKRLQG